MGNPKGSSHWSPRVVSVVFVLFLFLFSLDVFDPGRSVGEIAAGLFMHDIPMFILAGFTIIAWSFQLSGVAFVIGGLYIADWSEGGNGKADECHSLRETGRSSLFLVALPEDSSESAGNVFRFEWRERLEVFLFERFYCILGASVEIPS